MAVAHKRPMRMDVHGVLINYRLENNLEGPRIVMELAKENKALPILLVNHSKRRFRVSQMLLNAAPQSIENAAKALLQEYFCRLLEVKDPIRPTQEEKPAVDARSVLPLEVLGLADRTSLQRFCDWNHDTMKRYDSMMDKLLEKLPPITLKELVPDGYAKVITNRGLDISRVTSVLRAWFRYEMLLGTVTQNPWSSYTPYRRRKSAANSAAELIQKNLGNRMIPNCTIHRIVQDCLDGLRVTGNPRFLAALFCLCLTVSEEEVCALTRGDLYRFRFFPDRMAVSVHQVMQMKQRRYYREEITESNRIRMVPLPNLLIEAVNLLLNHERNKSLYDQPDRPLIYSAKNAKRSETPDNLNHWIYDTWKDLLGTLTTERKLPVLMRNTVLTNLTKSSMEDEEVRYLQGLVLKTTAGQHYCDYEAETELNRLALLEERWLCNLVVAAAAPYEMQVDLKRQGQQETIPFVSGNVQYVRFRFTILPVHGTPAKNLVLEISAPRGLAVTFLQREEAAA